MKNFTFGFLFLILMQLTLTGCSDLFGKKVVEKPLENGNLQVGCELEMDEFKKILEEDISPTISCLDKSLHVFMNVSELTLGTKLSRVALINHLHATEPHLDPKTYAILDAVFSLSNLITGEDKDFISKKNVELIIDLIKTFNFHAARLYTHTFGSEVPANLVVHEAQRNRVEQGAKEIQKALLKIYKADRNGVIHFTEIMRIVENFVNEDDDEMLDKVKGMLFIKKIVLGGDPLTLNHVELGFLFNNLPKLLSLVLDGVRYQYLDFEQQEMMKFVKDDVVDLSGILFHPSRGDRKMEGFFDINQAIEAIDRFMDEDKKISKYSALIIEAKKILTKTRNGAVDADSVAVEEWIVGKDLETIFNHIYNVTNRALNFHNFYNSSRIKPLLDAPQSVVLNPANYESEFPENKADLKEFARIVNSYRYMKGSFALPYYSLDYKRNADGPAEIQMYEYIIRTAFGYYGSSLSMDDKQLKAILIKFENELIELDMIVPRRAGNISETISLLGSLFQNQSDDNKVLDVDEATEFVITLVGGMKVADVMFDFYKQKGCAIDKFDRIEPGCFNAHFYENLCVNYRKYFPRLFESLGADANLGCDQDFSATANQEYLTATVQAARNCNVYPDDKAEIEYSNSDIMSIVVAMMHIETTITRWDKNQNNIMDSAEVMDAYTIYAPAIEGMLPDIIKKAPPKIASWAAKKIYMYLVKYEKAPGTDTFKEVAKLVQFLASFKQKAPAKRKTIASILRVVSEQSAVKAAKDPNYKPFLCEWMRDPANIPRD